MLNKTANGHNNENRQETESVGGRETRSVRLCSVMPWFNFVSSTSDAEMPRVKLYWELIRSLKHYIAASQHTQST